jgi:hypothetical protein
MRTELDRWMRLLARVEVPAGVALIAAGFGAVGLGWLEASGTADMRIQMQDLISGAIAGLGMIVVGSALLCAHVVLRASTRLITVTRGPLRADVPAQVSGADREGYVATHASYHRAGCDLLDGRDGTRPVDLPDAATGGLTPCAVCRPEPVR